jgi:hypothetical protein
VARERLVGRHQALDVCGDVTRRVGRERPRVEPLERRRARRTAPALPAAVDRVRAEAGDRVAEGAAEREHGGRALGVGLHTGVAAHEPLHEPPRDGRRAEGGELAGLKPLERGAEAQEDGHVALRLPHAPRDRHRGHPGLSVPPVREGTVDDVRARPRRPGPAGRPRRGAAGQGSALRRDLPAGAGPLDAPVSGADRGRRGVGRRRCRRIGS